MSDATFECPSCGKRFRWKPDYAGRRVKCKCEQVIQVPAHDPAETAALEVDDAVAPPPPATASPTAAQQCPSCGAGANAGAVICVECGYNFKSGKSLDTTIARPVKGGGGAGGGGRTAHTGVADGFFGRMARSWEFAKISYGILWDFKSLLIFPLQSGLATIVVLASFILPLWGTGEFEQWMAFLDDESGTNEVPLSAYLLTFLFYFCCYFVIVFFNTALTAAALKVCDGETPTVGYGLSVAMKRLPQIFGWALVSAVIGVLLKVIENAHEKAGRIIAAVIGTAWTVLTFFVVPVLATEGVGPVQAVKDSIHTLKSTWGEAVIGNFSLGWLNFLVSIPAFLVCGAVLFLAFQMNSMIMVGLAIGLFVVVALVLAVTGSAADVVFKALLYNYATGRNVPADLDDELLDSAFGAQAS